MRVHSYAKINWALRITGIRADGYHDIETLFQTISLHDTLIITPADRLSMTCDDAGVPADDANLVLRAARAIGAPPVRIELRKRIPAGGGLGGGSSNAAATLIALDEMFELRTPHERMHEIALSLGSDVPFFLVGGTAYATGRGEQLTPLPAAAPIPLLLLFPEERVSTPEAFALIRDYSKPIGVDRYRQALKDDLLDHTELLVNDFEKVVLPRLGTLKNRLIGEGAAWAGMTGSGSTIVGAFRSPVQRDAARGSLRDLRCEAAETIGAGSNADAKER